MAARQVAADYEYHINQERGTPVLVIVDLNQGGMSVTNDIEAVVHGIAREVGDLVWGMPIIYRDSEGNYDGVDGHDIMMGLSVGLFYSLDATDEDEAVQAAIKRERRRVR